MKTSPPQPLPQRAVLKIVPSGEIAIESGGDGVFLRFDCDCSDALPFCKAACCALPGIDVTAEDKIVGKIKDLSQSTVDFLTHPHGKSQLTTKGEDGLVMARRSDGYCCCNNPLTKLCSIYPDRPQTCHDFHCTRGDGMRGWRLDLARQISEE